MARGGGPATEAGPSPAAPERPATGDVALLVDWENLKIGLERMRITPNVTALYDASRDYGRVVVARAYADWLERDMHADPPALYRAGLEPVYVPKRKIALSGAPSAIVKNSVDVRMAVDAATLCHTNPNIGTFVLVSGDQDFLHVVNALRPYGRQLILIGVTGSLSAMLAEFVDEVLYYDRDIVGPPEPEERPREKGGPSVDAVFNGIQDILRRADPPGVASFSYVGQELRKRFPRYDPRIHGYKSLRRLMQAAKEKGVIAGIETIDVQDWAFLKGHAQALKQVLRER